MAKQADSSTKKRLSKEDRRISIVKAATKVFADYGYQRATTAEIAQVAGISEALLYRHFASKKEMFIEVLASTTHKLETLLEFWRPKSSEQDAANSTQLQIEQYIESLRRLSEFIEQDETFAAVFLHLLAELEDEEVREIVRSVYEDVLDRFRISTADLQTASASSSEPTDRDFWGWMFFACAQLIATNKRLQPTPSFQVETFISGLRNLKYINK